MSSTNLLPGRGRFELGGSAVAAGVQPVAILLLVLVVALLRLPTIGYSALNQDESVYTLIAAGLKSGLMPYVDIVDRKPIGLFLIFGFAQTFFHDGVVGPRVLAGAATVLSSYVLVLFSRRFLTAVSGASVAAGLFFGSYTILFGGDAAQAPVFYMPLVIGSAYLVALNLERLVARHAPSPANLGIAGLLLGLALQIKYSMVLECIGFGGLLILCGWAQWQHLNAAARRALALGLALMIAGGLAPTIVVGALYAVLGHFDAWYFYNFTVNFGRESSDYAPRAILERIVQFTVCILPLAVLAAAYFWDRRAPLGKLSMWSTRGWIHAACIVWLVCAFLGGLALRQPYAHYFYGVIAPLALLAGAAFQRPGASRISVGGALVVLGLLGFTGFGYAFGWRHEIDKNGSPRLAYKIADLLRSNNAGSLFVFNQYGILYYLTGQQPPTKYPLPSHLTRALEANSFQFDGQAELARVLATHPEMIVVSRPFNGTVAPDRITLLDQELKAGYCTLRTYQAGRHTVFVYRYDGDDPEATVDDTCDDD